MSLLIMASMMIHSPENFISDWKKIDTNDTLKILYVNQIGDNGVEIMIACITTFLGSVLLILGLLYKHSGFIMPWLLINISYLFAGFGIFISKLASPDTHFHFMKIVAVFCYHILLAYFIISVFSYHTFLKRQRLLAQNILHLQSTSSLNSDISHVSLSNTELQSFPSSRPRSLKSLNSD